MAEECAPVASRLATKQNFRALGPPKKKESARPFSDALRVSFPRLESLLVKLANAEFRARR